MTIQVPLWVLVAISGFAFVTLFQWLKPLVVSLLPKPTRSPYGIRWIKEVDHGLRNARRFYIVTDNPAVSVHQINKAGLLPRLNDRHPDNDSVAVNGRYEQEDPESTLWMYTIQYETQEEDSPTGGDVWSSANG